MFNLFNRSSKQEVLYVPLRRQDVAKSDPDAVYEEVPLQASQPRRRRLSLSSLLAVLGKLIMLGAWSYLVFYATTAWMNKQGSYGPRRMSSPLEANIVYEEQHFDLYEEDHEKKYFTSPPNADVDRNWHELIGHQHVRVSPSFMKEIGRLDEGIKLPDGNYLGAPRVFHYLHCLNNVYKSLHPRYYKLDKYEPPALKAWNFHIDHCMLMIKEALMCRADPVIDTMGFDDTPVPFTNFSAPSQCVKWDHLMDWVDSKYVNIYQDGMIVHPKFGPVNIPAHTAD